MMKRPWLSFRYFAENYRNYSTTPNVTSKQKLKILKDAYLCEGKYRSSVEMAQDLAQNIVYYDKKNDTSGLIVINKPAGVPLKTSQDALGLVDAMPDLSKLLGLEKITVVKSVHKYASGCVLLASKEQGVSQLKRSLNRRNQLIEHCLGESYFALTNSNPRKSSIQETVDVLHKEIKSHGSTVLEPVIERILVNNKLFKRRDQKLKRIAVNAEIVSKSPKGQSTLVKIEPSSLQYSFIQIYMADLLSPIIGDSIYGHRAKMLMGKMVKVNPELLPDVNSRLQNLPESMLSQLGLRSGEEHMLPLHLHLGRVHLPGYFGGSNHLTIHAPPRPFFKGTAEMLNIDIPEHIFEDNDVRDYDLVRKRTKPKEPTNEVLNPELSNIAEETPETDGQLPIRTLKERKTKKERKEERKRDRNRQSFIT